MSVVYGRGGRNPELFTLNVFSMTIMLSQA